MDNIYYTESHAGIGAIRTNTNSERNIPGRLSVASDVLHGIFPLTNLINRQKYGNTCQKNKFSHLFYMDDLKLFAKNEDELEKLLSIVKSFSDSIKMNFNTDNI